MRCPVELPAGCLAEPSGWREPGLGQKMGLAGLLKGGGGPRALREEAGRPLQEHVLVSEDTAKPIVARDVVPPRAPGGRPGPGGRGAPGSGDHWLGKLWVGGSVPPKTQKGPRRHSHPCLFGAGPSPSPVPGTDPLRAGLLGTAGGNCQRLVMSWGLGALGWVAPQLRK